MKAFNIFSGLASAMVISLGINMTASADPILFCNNGPGIDLVADGCISGQSRHYVNGGDGVYSNAGGGDPEAAVEAAILAATGSSVDISLYGKSDSDAGLFSFTGVASAATSGTWDVLDDLVEIAYITVKAANSFALYAVEGANSGLFSTAGILNNGGSQPVVSHISFWTTGAGTPPPPPVPEPATLFLLSAGLLGFAGAKRRKK